MLLAIIAVGFGLIVAMGGAILLDRERFDHKPRQVYALSTVAGLAIVASSLIAF